MFSSLHSFCACTLHCTGQCCAWSNALSPFPSPLLFRMRCQAIVFFLPPLPSPHTHEYESDAPVLFTLGHAFFLFTPNQSRPILQNIHFCTQGDVNKRTGLCTRRGFANMLFVLCDHSNIRVRPPSDIDGADKRTKGGGEVEWTQIQSQCFLGRVWSDQTN